MKIGVVFPQTEISSDPAVIKEFAQGIEDLGFNHLLAYDHVIGKNTANIPDWNMPYSHQSSFQEPLMLFSFLAGVTSHLSFVTSVIILPQRQTALVAKQAANLDIYCGGRLRLGVGIGWNKVEFDALNEQFDNRARRMEEQIEYLRHCWTEESFIYKSAYHSMDNGGINPLPVQRPIPVWIGGFSEAAMKRAARIGDGWIPYAISADAAESTLQTFRTLVMAEGRDAASVPVENIIFMGKTLADPVRTAEEAAKDARLWQSAGVDYVSLDTMGANLRGVSEHLDTFERFKQALGD